MTYVDKVDILQDVFSIFLGEEVIAAPPGDGPVHQVEIHIVNSQIVQRLLQRTRNVSRIMLVVPQLGRDEYFFARDTAPRDGVPDGFLGPVPEFIGIGPFGGAKLKVQELLTRGLCRCGDIPP